MGIVLEDQPIVCEACGGRGTYLYTKSYPSEPNNVWTAWEECVTCFGLGWFGVEKVEVLT